MKQVLIKKGRAITAEVPAPGAGPGEVLVRVAASCISSGTEMSGLKSSGLPLWKRALRHPTKVAATLKAAKEQGIGRVWRAVESKLESGKPTGYSAAGVVVEVGEGVADFKPGDRVACAGGGHAVHAGFVRVPHNLCVYIPDNVDIESASTVALGAIALQGVRRAQPTIGETFVVIGLGFLGQLTVQILRANGCKTIGIDLDEARVRTALELGMDSNVAPESGDEMQSVARLTDGLGADGVIITAATPSDSVVSTAFRICRKKGRVVLVGDVGLNLNRADFYSKEIDFLISTSYGPGRYDRVYEEAGLDYPVAYVRWTENRNMAEFLRLVDVGAVRVTPLISATWPVGEAERAFDALGKPETMIALLTYPDGDEPSRTTRLNPASTPQSGRIRVAVIGAGSFARTTHLPNLAELADRYTIQAVVTQSGASAAAAAQTFGAHYASTDLEAVLADPEVDAVLIATRHALHADMALAALRAGKHVLVEKPLALNARELDAFNDYFTAAGVATPVLLTGYNRRFSRYGAALKSTVGKAGGPFILNYRMNAGYLPRDHWVHGADGGGRNLGEACHLYDLFTFLTDSEAISVSAHSLSDSSSYYGRSDNFVATVTFADGSLATLTYTSMGSSEYPKEVADLYVGGGMAVMTDFRSLAFYGHAGSPIRSTAPEKGHRQELVEFADAINSGKWPIPWWQQEQAMRIALTVEEALNLK